MTHDGPKDPVDEAIGAVEAADAALPQGTEEIPVMVAQAVLTRNGGPLRVVVPKDFRDEDVVGVIELTMKLLAAANAIRAQRPDGLVLPDKPKLVGLDGGKIS